MARTKELYSILGVDETASDKEIESAYNSLIADCPETDPRHSRIVEAYAILSDIDRRAQYDVTGKVSRHNRKPNSAQGHNDKIEKTRYILNTLFMVGAVITTICFLLQWGGLSTTPFYWACGVSLLIKVTEYILRLIP
jgi:DnaJ-class molecular chaperone